MEAPPPVIVTKRKRFPIWLYAILFLLIAAFTVAPIASVMFASWIAQSHGCRLDESAIHPCVINGTDQGQTLSTLAMMGWLMLATLPIGAVLFVVWLAILFAHAISWGRKRRMLNAAPSVA